MAAEAFEIGWVGELGPEGFQFGTHA